MDDRSDDGRKEKKRHRDEPGLLNAAKRNRFDADEPGVSSPDVSLQDDLLNILDDSDGTVDQDPTIHGLDYVIKSFEEEIQDPEALKMGSESTFPPTELGYLLEASDDELGLPPSFGSSEDEGRDEAYVLPATSSGDFGFTDSLTFEDDMRNYDSLEYGICGPTEFGGGMDGNGNGNCSEFVALGGLFDNGYSFDGGDVPELLWQPETLPAV